MLVKSLLLLFVLLVSFSPVRAQVADLDEIVCYSMALSNKYAIYVYSEPGLDFFRRNIDLSATEEIRDSLQRRLGTPKSHLVLTAIHSLSVLDKQFNRNHLKIAITFEDGHQISERIINSISFPENLKECLRVLPVLPAGQTIHFYSVFDESVDWDCVETVSAVFKDSSLGEIELSPIAKSTVIADQAQ